MSFYLGDIVTIVDKDWELLKSNFLIPDDMTRIDFEKLKTNGGVVATAPQTLQLSLDLKENSCDCH